LRGKGDVGRCKAAGSKKPEAYSLEYVEDFFGPRTTQMPADRLPQQNGITRTDSYMQQHGYTIIPINPNERAVLRERA
jgi:hypothetical protein